MTKLTLIAAVALLAAAAPAHAAGTVQVSFIQPERFSDVRDAYLSSTRNLEALKQHLEAAAARYLNASQKLSIDVLDVNLAGKTEMTRTAMGLRVLRGRADWPRIELRYTLESAGSAARSGQATVSDMAYLQHGSTSRFSGEALHYERRMLDAWFRAEFSR